MRQWRSFILFCFIFSLATDISYAAPIIYRQQRMKAMKQQQQGMTQEQYPAIPGISRTTAGDQSQQARLQHNTYQQTVDQRNQAIAQAILNAHNQAVSNENVPTGNNGQSSPTANDNSGVAQQVAMLSRVLRMSKMSWISLKYGKSWIRNQPYGHY